TGVHFVPHAAQKAVRAAFRTNTTRSDPHIGQVVVALSSCLPSGRIQGPRPSGQRLSLWARGAWMGKLPGGQCRPALGMATTTGRTRFALRRTARIGCDGAELDRVAGGEPQDVRGAP